MIAYWLIPGWRADDTELLAALREVLDYAGSHTPDRASDWLLTETRTWPKPLEKLGPQILSDVCQETGITFTSVCYQAYRNGTGCGWHHDRQYDAQAILSLGTTRTFGLRNGKREDLFPMLHGDLLVMPPGFQHEWEHNLIPEEVRGERCSLVFRSPAM